MHTLTEQSQIALTQGSKSFSLASKFFSEELSNDAAHIYYWCRHCDDEIDEGHGDLNTVEDLSEKTKSIYSTGPKELDPPFMALNKVVHKYNIPQTYPVELIEGMRMDVEKPTYDTIKELELYCYRVASTVGLMMSHVMGVFDQRALREAASLGMAMQMTNISRDVYEDKLRSRIYLPMEWLKEQGLTAQNLLRESNRKNLFEVVKRLIRESEKHYEAGRKGIINLPIRPALAVTIAYYFYREIGREILRRGESAILNRVVVSPWRKSVLIIMALWEVVSTLPRRAFSKRSLVNIQEIWRPS